MNKNLFAVNLKRPINENDSFFIFSHMPANYQITEGIKLKGKDLEIAVNLIREKQKIAIKLKLMAKKIINSGDSQ